MTLETNGPRVPFPRRRSTKMGCGRGDLPRGVLGCGGEGRPLRPGGIGALVTRRRGPCELAWERSRCKGPGVCMFMGK